MIKDFTDPFLVMAFIALLVFIVTFGLDALIRFLKKL